MWWLFIVPLVTSVLGPLSRLCGGADNVGERRERTCRRAAKSRPEVHEHIKLDGSAVRDEVQNEMSRYQPDEPFRRNWEPPPPRPPRPPSRPWIWLALILATALSDAAWHKRHPASRPLRARLRLRISSFRLPSWHHIDVTFCPAHWITRETNRGHVTDKFFHRWRWPRRGLEAV